MRNPPIVRAVVTDTNGDVLYDSVEPPRARRSCSARPVFVRHDAVHHRQTAYRTRRKGKAAGDLFDHV